MKRLLVLLLSCALLLACVPTPEEDAVRQKDTNVLIDTVLSEQKDTTESDQPPTPVREQFPERFSCDKVTETRHVHVTADVPIEILTDSVFPMARVERSELTDAQRLTVYKRLFGTDTLYRFQEHFTRESAAQWIEWLIQEPDKETWMRETGSTEEDFEKAQAHRREELKKYQDLYNSLSDDDTKVPLLEWDGSLPSFEERQLQVVGDPFEQEGIYQLKHADVSRFTDRAIVLEPAFTLETGSIHAEAFIYHREGFVRIDPKDYDTPQPGASVTPREAAALVLSVVAGVADEYVLSEIDWSNNADTDGDDKGVVHSYGYGVILTPSIQGARMIAEQSIAEAQDDEDAAQFARTWEYPRIVASVSPDGEIWGFKWYGPIKIAETLADSTPLLPLDTIQDLALQQINRKFSYESDEGAALSITRVQLGLFRIREKNNLDGGLLVPAWRIDFGDYRGTPEREQYWNGVLDLFVVINAVDGTVIDPYKGY